MQPMRRVAAILAALLLAVVPAACGGDDEPARDTGTAGEAQNLPDPGSTAQDQGSTAGDDGESLFASSCASCHTLAAADASGQIGPNLDDLAPDRDRVLSAIESGPGSMPANLYEGAEAEAVADYVASNAGQ